MDGFLWLSGDVIAPHGHCEERGDEATPITRTHGSCAYLTKLASSPRSSQ